MIKIEFDDIILRDMIESDIEDYVRWFTVEREWENWDAPWENEDSTEEIERKKWTEYYESVKTRSDDVLRWKFEIEWNGRHIGWVSSYHIDEKYEWIGEVKDDQTVYRTIGIDICESDLYGNGIGTKAFRTFTNYYFDSGVDELYTQTWSGNLRMIRCAEKLGFVECDREVGEREVDGKKYDGLTFRLKR
ncbi:MAG: GNAT family N-acetyltransferase [Lachnospiraceae bacterium]|nr:GNAT family N-acetyltransferase [Lachnospiraceae bacterium]